MGSVKQYLEEMRKQASAVDPAQHEKNAFESTIEKLAALKLAQDLAAAAEAIAPEALAEETVEEEVPAEGEITDPDEIAAALAEIVNQVEELPDTDQNTILEAADTLEDEEAAAGEKVSTVMDYVALLNYLGL